ncbi:hypothetical protein SOPP22_10255 [Shewanella sp. OPT22]|nr:hypothetical protein SOPP22_10255 [Shewanella sp. OPT22]
MSLISTRTIKENILANLGEPAGAIKDNTVLKLSNNCKYRITVIGSDTEIQKFEVTQERSKNKLNSNGQRQSNSLGHKIAKAFSKYFYFSATNRLKRTLNHQEVKTKLSEFNKQSTLNNKSHIIIYLKDFWGIPKFSQPMGPS